MLLSYSRKELSGLSSLRIVLALYLMMFHTVPYYKGLPAELYEIVSSGYMATSMFFLLSGFILSHVYLSGDGLRVSPGHFLRTRFFTLYPIHLIGLALSGAIALVQWKLTGSFYAVADVPQAFSDGRGDSLHVKLEGGQMLLSFFSHVFLLHAWNPHYLSFNVPSWSISALIFFYTIFVWIGPKLVNVRRPLCVLLALNVLYLLPPVWLISQEQFTATATGFLHTNPLARLPEFLAGVVLYRFMRKINHVHLSPVQFCLCLVGMGCLLFAVDDGFRALGPAGYYLAHNGGLLLFQCVLLVLFAGVREFRTPWLKEGVQRIGNASLSMFILHLPLFFLLTRLEKFIHFLAAGDREQPWWPQIKSMEPSFMLYPFIVLAVVLISVWCQESLVIKLRRVLAQWIGSERRPQINPA